MLFISASFYGLSLTILNCKEQPQTIASYRELLQTIANYRKLPPTPANCIIMFRERIKKMSCKAHSAGETRRDYSQLDEVLEEYGNAEGNLITVLQKTQEKFGYLPREVIEYIAGAMKLKTAKVYGVATFYKQFRFEPIGKYLIMLCKGTACHVNGAKDIEDAVCEELGITDGGTTDDGLFTLNNVACIGCCSLSPVMMINGVTYGLLTKEKVREIINSLRKQTL